MKRLGPHIDSRTALSWKSYPVRRVDKQPLLAFILEALAVRGCRIVHASDPGRAPFYIVFETPAAERHGILVYAFLANSKITTNRPEDEHRFQVKYGGDLKGVLEVTVDPHRLVTTLFLGIDPKEGVFVAADPLMNTPAPMSRSIEFKSAHVEAIRARGWYAWERDRRPGKSRDRPTAELEDLRTEVLVGGCQDRLLDLIQLERVACGLDPGERHLIADKLIDSKTHVGTADHPILKEFDMPPDTLLDLIGSAGRLKMAVRGWVAEQHLLEQLQHLTGVSDCTRLEAEGDPDISLRWKGSPPILIECKNTLRTTYSDGRPKVDFQRTRASKGDPCSRYYRPDDFPVLAACLHAVTERWEFRFALTADLDAHRTCVGHITNSVGVAEPTFVDRAEFIFDRYLGRGVA